MASPYIDCMKPLVPILLVLVVVISIGLWKFLTRPKWLPVSIPSPWLFYKTPVIGADPFSPPDGKTRELEFKKEFTLSKDTSVSITTAGISKLVIDGTEKVLPIPTGKTYPEGSINLKSGKHTVTVPMKDGDNGGFAVILHTGDPMKPFVQTDTTWQYRVVSVKK